MNTVIQPQKATPLFVISFLFACFAFSSAALAVSPPPDGGYPGGNTAEGQSALLHLSPQDGGFNTAVGAFSLWANVNGSFNTAVGAGALDLNTGHSNTAVGAAALLFNTTGSNNTANGVDALVFNSTGNGNTATGAAALFFNVTGPGNTAVGAQALFNNTGDNENPPNGRLNTAVGLLALYSNTTGNGNTAVGAGPGGTNPTGPLGSNTTGNNNTAVGGTDGTINAALGNNTTGNSNTAVGADALGSNTTGFWNTAVGQGALDTNQTGTLNTAVGKGALAALAPSAPNTGENNVAIGAAAGGSVITANNVICIGANIAGADVSDTAWIGNVYGVTTQNGTTAPVIVSADGQLGTVVSSERFKKDIATMDKASEAVMSLRPVTFHYKSDAKNTPQFGLIAEEVANVNPALVLPDKEGKPYTVRYDQVNAMLLNEFLKEHKAFVNEQHKVERLEVTIARQQKQIETLTAGLQKVSAQMELAKPATQTVLNNQ
jgi:hypothetical protein